MEKEIVTCQGVPNPFEGEECPNPAVEYQVFDRDTWVGSRYLCSDCAGATDGVAGYRLVAETLDSKSPQNV